MSNLAFLAIAAGVIGVGWLVLWLRTRRPKTLMSSIDEFHREMAALGGDEDEPTLRRGRERPEPIVPAPSNADLARKLREVREYHQPGEDDATGKER